MAYLPTAEDRAFVQQQTNGAVGWNEDRLNQLISSLLLSDPDAIAGQTDSDADDTVAPDLWAASAMVLEAVLIQKTLGDQYPGATSVKTADLGVTWKGTNLSALRALTKRYWRLADPWNREQWHSSGWRSVDVRKGDRHDLVDWPFGANLSASQVVNGANPFGLMEDTG